MEKRKVSIDATGKRVGRLASEIANILNGKDQPDYAPHIAPIVLVEVNNASSLEVSNKKKDGKVYTRYTGFFAGLRKTSMRRMIERKGYSEVLRKAVYGMLPSNKLRDVKLKNLIINE